MATRPAPPAVKTVLVTGAAGSVGTFLRRELAGRYRLRLSDARPVAPLAPGESYVHADVRRLADLVRATRGADAVVHLGGYAVEGPWRAILGANIVGTYNLFEAARRNAVRRVVFASSNHVTGFYPRTRTVDHRVPPRPDSRYAVSKVFGEALGRLYSDKYGMEVLCIRIGNVNEAPLDSRRLAIWLSPRDLAQLVILGIERPGLRFEVVYGTSRNRRSWYDNGRAFRLGYRPCDDSEEFAAAILAREPAADSGGGTLQGGSFTQIEAAPPRAAVPALRRRRAKTSSVRRRGRSL